ncbi:VTT domain-containing protein [Dechloromonas sp. H13]|uniref:VTT domain-containing protein n=1 Tax=Dechloromonas sp. H13 TaxID=2570193 RepID=UPI001292B7ED|nr:VTT domain-containing protein [Dechloromonas sp. H13]
MEISQITQALRQDVVWVVFLNVLLQQIGLPVPAVPTLLLAGSLVAAPGLLGKVLAAAIVASVLADWIWYLAGRAFGYRVLAGLCKLSINPGSCVSQTESRFIRWGVASLVVAKFIPGFSTVAPPIAGSMRMALPGFLAAAAVGAALWAGLALGAGWLLREQVHAALAVLDEQAGSALLIVLAVGAVWLGWKLWQKYRFRQFCTVPHITPDELLAALAGEQPPLFLDLRGATMIAATGPIPGATVAEHDFLLDAVGHWPKERPIVTLCACPEDAGAVQAARRLLEAGYLSVRPVQGGYEAWLAAVAKA